MPVISATQEAREGRSLEFRSLRPTNQGNLKIYP
jgi:hypothetical protein